MLRVPDGTGCWREISPRRSGVLQVRAHIPSELESVTALRVLVVADLLARVAERGGVQALTAYVGDFEEPADQQALRRIPDALGLHGPTALARSEEELPPPNDSPADVHVASAELAGQAGLQGLRLTVAGGRGSRREASGSSSPAKMLLAVGDAPLAVKLAMLSTSHMELVDLSADALEGARRTILEWQRRVAGWAEFPSRPVPPEMATTIRRCFDRLDSPAVIRLLSELAGRDDIAQGAKFEAFIYADQILALELERSIGQVDH
ncbi:MAG: hypothetical protein LBV34_15045 [Nocardiopsaceae bacterium]|nr:hypothetical protein [Nocardiopsaceae bacterium]